MRKRWVWDKDKQELVPAEEYYSERVETHYVQEDTMNPTFNHASGKTYDSKSEFRKAIKAAGCVEFGNEKIPEPKKAKPKGIREDLAREHAKLSYMSAGERANYINSLKE